MCKDAPIDARPPRANAAKKSKPSSISFKQRLASGAVRDCSCTLDAAGNCLAWSWRSADGRHVGSFSATRRDLQTTLRAERLATLRRWRALLRAELKAPSPHPPSSPTKALIPSDFHRDVGSTLFANRWQCWGGVSVRARPWCAYRARRKTRR